MLSRALKIFLGLPTSLRLEVKQNIVRGANKVNVIDEWGGDQSYGHVSMSKDILYPNHQSQMVMNLILLQI